jgi:hypothetical protein
VPPRSHHTSKRVRGDPMNEPAGVFVERVSDDGQWFDRGERVEFFPRAVGHLRPTLEKAALGSYEVLRCSRVRADGRRWLDVELQRVFQTMRSRRRRASTSDAGVGT